MRVVNILKPRIFVTQLIPDTVKVYLEDYFILEIWEQQEVIPKDILYEKTQAPKLKVVSNISVGYNNFDTNAMKKTA
jgi:glyoxylate/hydroxypyruvate/2-ketogluconate reductase